jgi:alcohol dehydrogenase (cytochrome c)
VAEGQRSLAGRRASVWHTPAVDPELGLLFFGTGNPGPDYNGLVRKGDNLFSSSTVAVDVKSGTYRWHFQHVHHDIWDYDVSTPPVLFDLTLDGRPRRGIAQPSKTGWVYILDRATGKPLIGIDERAVLQEPRQGGRHAVAPRGDAFTPVDRHRARGTFSTKGASSRRSGRRRSRSSPRCRAARTARCV